jgi:hypothetical protein
MLSVEFFIVMLSIVMPNVVMLFVVEPDISVPPTLS